MASSINQYIQGCIIRLLIESKQVITCLTGSSKPRDISRISSQSMIDGVIKREMITLTVQDILDIALVSKWWFTVVRQRSKIVFNGHLNMIKILESIQSSNIYSLCSSQYIQTLKWSFKDNHHKQSSSSFIDGNELIRQLPNLKTINFKCQSYINLPAMQALKTIQKEYPHMNIHIDTKFVLKDIRGFPIDSLEISKWSKYFNGGFTPNSVSLSTNVFKSIRSDGGYEESFIEMVKDLQPHTLRLSIDTWKGQIHLNQDTLLQHISPTIRHLEIRQDYIEFFYLKRIVRSDLYRCLESLKVIIDPSKLQVQINLGGGLGNGPFNKVLMDDWIESCNNIRNNTTLKRLHLTLGCDPSQLENVEIFQMAFDSIWSGRNKTQPVSSVNIDYLCLENMSVMMTPKLWDTFSHCKSITKLLLEDSLFDEMVPYLSNLISTNSTITVLSINGNYLKWSIELEQAFKSNQTITMLDVGYNQFHKDAYSFLSSLIDTNIQYLFLSDGFNFEDDIAPFLTESKSTKEIYW
ncbi:hypothetical protein DFA_07707 [Cavenderia fasciculata]|uniref:F-box domain-containing protein n=1 Tax=Cavenderia fasciculata TaxID=261658 RepID=F4Q2V3_CACFS|nr:uncharacterized protein DFA_07707 [Cavenderia fasciculata]EGG16729.1 hypothetical protein DFA_07707 [Cavenderia fasciculata]|eukprot:XP_004355203.1 hypothetical protein DFA_07707 [Cavenderia fasciculata]